MGGKSRQAVEVVALFFRDDAPYDGVGGVFAGVDDDFLQVEGFWFQAEVYAEGITGWEGQHLGLVAHSRSFQVLAHSGVNAKRVIALRVADRPVRRRIG